MAQLYVSQVKTKALAMLSEIPDKPFGVVVRTLRHHYDRMGLPALIPIPE
jgi:hypothetical protein